MNMYVAILEKRALWLKRQEDLFGDNETLPEICMAIRIAVSGQGDSWSQRNLLQVREFLVNRIVWWSDSKSPIDNAFDKAVLDLMKATLLEMNFYEDFPAMINKNE